MSNTPQTPEQRRKVIALVALVIVAGPIGFLVSRVLHQLRPAPAATPSITADADSAAAPAAPAAAVDAAATADAPVATADAAKIPESLPDFTLQDRDGKPRRLSEWAGRPLVVNFWATWCAPCRREIPLLNRTHAARVLPKLEIIGVAVDFRDDVLAYVQKTPIEYPLLIGEEDGAAAAKSFGMSTAVPFTVFADSKSRILAVKIGELHEDDLQLILGAVGEVDAGKLQLPEARERISTGLAALAAKRAAPAA